MARKPGRSAVVERVEKALLPDPFLLLDKKAVHYRDLSSRSAKRQRGDPSPDQDGFAKADVMLFRGGHLRLIY